MRCYQIAGLRVDMELSGRTLEQARPYEVADGRKGDFAITCDPKLILEWNPHLETEDLAEYMGTGVLFSRQLLNHDGFQLHASAVEWKEKAYLFSAYSGTGKSTHTEKWCRLFGATYLNDDKPALRKVDGKWMAYGTPWSGKHDLSSPRGVEIGGVAFLERASENFIRRSTPQEALPKLMSQCTYKLTHEQMDILLQLLENLLTDVPVWQLGCLNNDEAAMVSHSAMTGTEA